MPLYQEIYLEIIDTEICFILTNDFFSLSLLFIYSFYFQPILWIKPLISSAKKQYLWLMWLQKNKTNETFLCKMQWKLSCSISMIHNNVNPWYHTKTDLKKLHITVYYVPDVLGPANNRVLCTRCFWPWTQWSYIVHLSALEFLNFFVFWLNCPQCFWY